jgi:1-acyl-sn-glycerol-3-phosphate acyltransferase
MLRHHGAYATDLQARLPLGDRLFGRLDGWYYLKVGRVVLHGGRLAARGRYTSEVWAQSSADMLGAVEACGGNVQIEGLTEVLRTPGPVVYVSNHMSMLETFLLPAILLTRGDVSFVVKEDLLRYPAFGRLLGACEPVSVTRRNPREDFKQVMTQGAALLQKGRSVTIFPQSTRMVRFDPGQFNTLGCKLAARAGVPLVPVALKTDWLGVGKLVRDFGPLDRTQPIHIRFGAPMAVEGTGRETHAAVVRFIAGSLREWGMDVVEQNAENAGRKTEGGEAI